MKFYSLLFVLLTSTQVSAQQNYWQQYLRYDIKAELDPREKTITGFETIVYKNNSPSTLDFIWFHIWPNAYKDKTTALIQQISNDTKRSKKMDDFGKGHIEGLAFTIDNVPAKTEAHPRVQYIDIIKLLLNKPLKPGDSISISTAFKVMLPPYFSRSGYADGEFMACQWYPKPAVFDKKGWHEFPYLDMGEFYSEFADYTVSLTLPSDYVVGATGTLLTLPELEAYKKIGAENVAKRNVKPRLYKPTVTTAKKTLRYHAQNVPDFAWFAEKDFVIQYDTIQMEGGNTIDAFSYYHDKKNTIWNNSIDYIKDAVRKYSAWIGEYAYPVVQVVEGPKNNSSGGMEYPMVTLITSPDAKVETLDAVIAHEIGHNWFMGMLGSNERDHTWMDEGLNTYYQFRYEAEKYRGNSVFGDGIPKEIKQLPTDEFLRAVYNVIAQNVPMQSAIDIPADKFPNSDEYGLVSYVKTAVWMYLLESSVGRVSLDMAMRNYFNTWKFKHPQPEDMQAAFEETLMANLGKFFALTKKEGKLE
ncbi:MAG TPA: M1 family metallopeptidase [Ferruginibacter sp.]|nr:M1 family metallopeptidase [Ferruginibacter sp.]